MMICIIIFLCITILLISILFAEYASEQARKYLNLEKDFRDLLSKYWGYRSELDELKSETVENRLRNIKCTNCLHEYESAIDEHSSCYFCVHNNLYDNTDDRFEEV